jgi:peptidoglycan L-alanyl-D-glutamate endopeptidase CwlK
VIDKLAGVHPVLARRVGAILEAMTVLGFPMMVTDGVRTTAQQQALYAKGRTAPGQRVTNVDGVTKTSNHQPKADGYGHAVDCCFLDERGKPSWADTHPWRLYGEMAKALGLVWGGDWKSIVDKPHIELPKGKVIV